MSLGWLINQRLALGRDIALPLAPITGWATQSVISLALSSAMGFSIATILASAAIMAVLALVLPRWKSWHPERDAGKPPASPVPVLPISLYVAAAVVALLPPAAVVPKFLADGVALAGPIFDHSKVALINEMLRTGVPPANPFFAGDGGDGHVSYYYLWHYSAAQIARLTGASGWEADIGLSWFSAFASLMTMCGLALRLSRRRLPAILVLVFSVLGSLRPVLVGVFGEEPLHAVLKHGSGLAGWLFQTSWSPHHVAAAACVVITVLLLVELSLRPSIFATFILALLLAAGFQSSVWVGGITLALCAPVIGVLLLARISASQRRLLIVASLAGAAGAILLSFPLISSQLQEQGARGGNLPIVIHPAPVLGVLFPPLLRRILDIPAYWLILLPIEFPLVFVPGLIGLRHIARANTGDQRQALIVQAFTGLCLGSLCCGWLLLSTIGDNNDLGWRAVLPGLFILTIASSIVVSHWLAELTVRRFVVPAAALLAAFVAALPDTAHNISGNLFGHATPSARAFAQSPDLWVALRKYTTAQTRIANNPAYLQDVTPWPINISWALLADRRSCFAGNELAIAFASLPAPQRLQISALFLRVFDGTGSPGDIGRLYHDYGCRAAVVTPQDGAWNNDLFADSRLFRLAEAEDGKWRIYVAANGDNVTTPQAQK
jgi:hypothetical protein